MDKGISLFFGFNSPVKNRMKNIKKVGFDCIITNADPRFDYQNGHIDEQVKLCKECNLKLSSLHMKYRSRELTSFWENSDLGDTLESNLIEDVLDAAKYGFKCVVVHIENLSSDYEIGFNRLERVLNVCKEVNVPLAFENIFDQETFLVTMEHFKDNPYAKMCYDSGHNHCFDPDFDYIEKFKDKIICLHLHDNMGGKIDIKEVRKNGYTDYTAFDADFHTLNKYGNINWEELAKKLATIPNEVSLDYELLFHKNCNISEKEVLEEAIKQANELQNLILKYK